MKKFKIGPFTELTEINFPEHGLDNINPMPHSFRMYYRALFLEPNEFKPYAEKLSGEPIREGVDAITRPVLTYWGRDRVHPCVAVMAFNLEYAGVELFAHEAVHAASCYITAQSIERSLQNSEFKNEFIKKDEIEIPYPYYFKDADDSQLEEYTAYLVGLTTVKLYGAFNG